MKVGIVLKPQHVKDFQSLIPNLSRWLSRRGHQPLFLDHEMDRIEKIFRPSKVKNIEFLDTKNFFKASQLIISLGGDGTLIGICRQLSRGAAPILGVNMGKLGFITEFNKAEFFDGLELALTKKLRSIQIQLYTVKVTRRKKAVFKSYFINDAVLNKPDISRMFSLKVETQNEALYDISGDGLIISSPIGSTAYSLAAGGPIIQPSVKAMALTPICPHSLTHRPIVISDNEVIQINVTDNNSPITITLDGQESFKTSSRDIIEVKKNNGLKIKLLKNPERSYFQTLREKFTYGRR